MIDHSQLIEQFFRKKNKEISQRVSKHANNLVHSVPLACVSNS